MTSLTGTRKGDSIMIHLGDLPPWPSEVVFVSSPSGYLRTADGLEFVVSSGWYVTGRADLWAETVATFEHREEMNRLSERLRKLGVIVSVPERYTTGTWQKILALLEHEAPVPAQADEFREHVHRRNGNELRHSNAGGNQEHGYHDHEETRSE